ncbi:zinc ribbon domain-containing protein [Shewanella intestini]|uniref:Zinc ribbon domain-containing protein n=1 Tax=Shewanella intestini TaxID=2017544 RepID=A0ABS5HZI5_9GAMM|nr:MULTISPECIES: zinc ribbon domain-containing protein [Shewanella]MBR9727207.1 zinc ribbon domain-containing protein [Shewanella intestini]MRG36009.1 zinc ribbon domain-containing protein [Shewanella sp. XMDDZSB0408]
MALVECPRCQKRISSKAKQCSHCQTSINGNLASLAKISHIEKSNQLMNHTFIFLTLFVAGAVLWFWGGEVAQGSRAIVAISSFAIGFSGYLITRIRIVMHKRKSV